MLRDYPDLRFTINELLPLDQSVAVRVRWHGTHRTTGDPMRRTGLVLFRVGVDGRIAERRSVYREE